MPFSLSDIVAILPELIVVAAACILLLVEIILPRDKKHVVAYFAIAFVVLAAWYTYTFADVLDGTFMAGMFAFDGFSVFFKAVFYIAAVLSILLSLHYVKEENIELGEYYVLMLFSLSGMMVVASGADLLTIYLGLELMSLPVYVLVGFKRKDVKSNEASMKYIILGAFSSGVLLYGISLIYGVTGTTSLEGIAAALSSGGAGLPLFSVGLVMMVVGFGFKVAAFPLHMWAPDAYEGAPTPITAFMSVGVKAAAFAAVARVFMTGFAPAYDDWQTVVTVLALLSLVLGNTVAIAQTNIKRMLAYSSIGHAGYALLGVAAGTEEGMAGVMFYMLVYAFMNLGVFGVIVMMRKGASIGEDINDYRGLAREHKALALVMLIFLFSLAGIPPTAGFVGKFYIFMALIHQGMIATAVIALVTSAVAAYFYIRLVMIMYMKEPEGKFELASSTGILCVLFVSTAAVVGMGILPGCFIELARLAAVIP